MHDREPIHRIIGALCMYAAGGILLAALTIEWLAGCGEHYIDAQGTVHNYECVFIPQRVK